jgi:hypothetical protein
MPRYGDPAGTAVALAREIIRRRAALDAELQDRITARQRGKRRPPGRGTQHILAARREVDGMVLALSWLIGYPDEPWTARTFITQVQGTDQEKKT